MAPSPHRPDPERGVALLIVLVVLFIIAVLMVDITLTATTARRSARNSSSDFLMDAAIDGRLLVMQAQLTFDGAENKIDSPDDRWARPEFAEYTAPEKSEEEKEESKEAEARVIGDSDEVSVTARCEAENAKFNLYIVMHPDKNQRDAARERLAVLIDRFREDTPLDISRTKADEMRDRIVEYLERAAPGDDEKGKYPVPKTAPWRILTPDELRYVDGLEDAAHGLGAEGILYDARDPKAAREYDADPENGTKPEICKGLLHYITLWSGTSWAGKPNDETWKSMIAVNVNLAEKPVLETLFHKNSADMIFAERIIEYRGADKDGSKTETKDPPKVDEPLPLHQYFTKLEDLKKVDGLDDAVFTRNSLGDGALTLTSDTFSLDFLAKRDKSFKQVRYVVRRNNQGIQTLLREERADPRLEEEEEKEAKPEGE